MKVVRQGLVALLALLAAAVVGLFLALVAWTLLDPVDGCMDGGGCWDAVDAVCRRDEPDAQQLCWRVPAPGRRPD